MLQRLLRIGSAMIALALCTGFVLNGAERDEWRSAAASGKRGTTITLAAGTFPAAGVTVASGVTLRGAGVDKTVLDAGGAETALIFSGSGGGVSDLTIRNALGPALTLDDAGALTVARVRLADSGVGVAVCNGHQVRLENLLVTGNRAGVAINGGERNAVVNCTLADNSELGLSLTGTRDCAVFNNLVTGSQTGVMAATDNQALTLDYNLYIAFFVGSTTGEPPRESLPSWRSRFGYDRHSVELKLAYANAQAGDYRPVTPLPWAPGRTTASDWGIAELAGVTAPERDLAGNRRQGRPDLGAFEVTLTPTPRADGHFTVTSDEGVTSAGLFTPDGRNVAWLFHNLPLAKGDYEFVLPPGVQPGAYELRVVESDLRLRYILPVGSIGVDNRLENSNPIDPTLVVFDHQDNPVMFQGGAEDGTLARSFEPGLQKARWRLGGGGGAAGAAVTPAGELFFLRGEGMLHKINAATGEGMPIAGASFRKPLKDVFSPKVAGMVELDGNLYVADPEKNRLFVTGIKELTFARGFDLPAPRWPSADRVNKLLWVISGNKLVALDTSGAKKAEATPVPDPVALSVNAGRLAVYSAATKRVHVFDCTDPAKLKPLTVIGQEWKPGDTGLGRIQLDRLSGQGTVALAANGDVVVLDAGAPKLFKADGTFLRAPMPMWGQFVACGWWTGLDGKPEFQVAGMGWTQTMVLNLDKESWEPGTRYSLPADLAGTIAAFFTEGARNFVACTEDTTQKRWLVRIDPDGVGKPVLLFAPVKDKAEFTVQTDANGDGVIDDKDPAGPVNGPDGKPVPHLQFLTDGSLLAGGRIVPRRADGKGGIAYDWSMYDPALSAALPTGGQGQFNGGFLADGSWLATGGKGRGFGGGFTALSAVGTDGKPRWEHPLDYHCTIGAFRSARVLPGLVLGTATEELDTFFLTHDGLGLGIVGPDAAFRWSGYWHDQDWSLRTFESPAGRQYVLLGDYVRHTAHWLEIMGRDTVKRTTVMVTVSAARAAELAAATTEPVHDPIPPKVIVPFAKLAAPLTIDGDLKKWRAAGVTPAIVVIPPGIAPGDCSAVIRCAWEGDDLYFQVIKFDNVVTMHQPLNFHYKQDSTELALVGGFMGGFKFAITRVTDAGDILYREQFLMKKELNLDPAKAPRRITVLDNAKDIEERRLVEGMTGADLSEAKVIVTEFKIPMSYAWDGKAPIAMKSGTGFWFGWFIDDNDTPGLDEQKAYPWPVIFAAFGSPDQGAWGILQ